MTKKEFKKLKIKDKVIVNKTLKDGYGEIWHHEDDIATIKYFTSDGVGVIFEWSDLGLNYKYISKVVEESVV